MVFDFEHIKWTLSIQIFFDRAEEKIMYMNSLDEKKCSVKNEELKGNAER